MLRTSGLTRQLLGSPKRRCNYLAHLGGGTREDPPRRPSPARLYGTPTQSLLSTRLNITTDGLHRNTQIRHFSADSNRSGNEEQTAGVASSEKFGDDTSIDDTLNKLFEESAQEAAASDTSWYSTSGIEQWEPSAWWNVADQCIAFVLQVHDYTGLSFGWSIVAATFGLRLVVFPLMGMAQRTTSRMIHVSPHLKQLQAKMERRGTLTREEQLQFASQYKALFRKYQVTPLWAMIPLAQLPIFGGLFFGLKKIPTLFPNELSNGGMYWFSDLTVPDPFYILPAISTLTLLGMFEINKEQMLRQSPGSQGQFMLNFFRVMGLVSFPVTLTFDAPVVLMWATNSTFMLAQTAFFHTSVARNIFGIWDLPKQVPGQTEDAGLTGSINNMIKRAQGEPVNEKEKIEQHNKRVETKKSFRLARERRKRLGITGKRNV